MLKYLKFFVFLFLLLLIFAFTDHRLFFEIPTRLANRPVLFQAVFYVNYLGLLISCLILFTVKSKAVRLFFGLFFFITLAISLAMEMAHGNSFTKIEANIIFTEFQFSGEAFSAFFYPYIKAIALAFSITGLLGFLAYKYLPRTESIYALTPLVFVAYSVKLNFSSNSWHTLFPTVFNVPIVAADAFFSIPRFGPRETTYIQPVQKGMYQHIIWIVDESVRGDMLSVNNSTLKTTPFLESIKGKFYNYGIMSASSQYSYGSNMVLQSGLQLKQIPDPALRFGKQPNIFQYGKKAGYSTYFIDGQNKSSVHMNGMTHYDFASIDHSINIHKIKPNIQWPDVDSTIVHYIKEILQSKQPTFTYINKAGCHFAYNHFYPAKRTPFQPSYTDGDSWTDSTVLRNTYANCINWSVDAFFRKLSPVLFQENTIILYTSDHGVTLLEKGRPVQDTGPINPLPARANVPFFVFTDKRNPGLFQAASNNQNKLTQFSIFSSTLYLMGYDSIAINRLYGESIFTSWKKAPRLFFSGTIYDPKNCYINVFD